MSGHIWQHSIQHFFIQCGSGGVIEVDAIHKPVLKGSLVLSFKVSAKISNGRAGRIVLHKPVKIADFVDTNIGQKVDG